ncbi:hypothetical protein UNDYM_1616 [Undibacterium sp. YM2]|uniref:hypothetical protein n=1 Tax=Undibacterium sp. YM2 TaxID=2058625 RepID=UPI001331D35A|nr:hypothetical protein [Undibacterium sp. YM2]BBB65869.1 hypothetical protein UNDYM_1616 [Undibacterium sp. YM2]
MEQIFEDVVISIYPVEKTEDGFIVALMVTTKTESQANAAAIALEKLICGQQIEHND